MEYKDQWRELNIFIGERIKTRRRQKGWSQGDLGNTVDLTFQQIQKYEHGTNRIGAALLKIMAGRLEVPITYFFEGLDDMSAEVDPQEVSYVLRLLDLIPPDVKRNMVAIMETLASQRFPGTPLLAASRLSST